LVLPVAGRLDGAGGLKLSWAAECPKIF